MADMDEDTVRRLLRIGVQPDGVKPRALKDAPVTASAGIPGLLAYDVPDLQNTTTRGMVLPKKQPGEKDRMFLRPNAGQDVVAHETEHLLAERGLGASEAINKKFDELVNDPKLRNQFVKAAIANAPYLEEKYGLKNAYFDPRMYDFQGSLAPNLLYEQLASLASVEATQGVDLTKDPVLRKSLFKDKDVRETYNALVGLRQTRLDPRDLPPHTRQPEKQDETGAVDKLKQLLGFANGGSVPRKPKLI